MRLAMRCHRRPFSHATPAFFQQVRSPRRRPHPRVICRQAGLRLRVFAHGLSRLPAWRSTRQRAPGKVRAHSAAGRSAHTAPPQVRPSAAARCTGPVSPPTTRLRAPRQRGQLRQVALHQLAPPRPRQPRSVTGKIVPAAGIDEHGITPRPVQPRGKLAIALDRPLLRPPAGRR